MAPVDLTRSVERMERFLLEVLDDDWGANAYEEVLRHLEVVLADLRASNRSDDARRRISAFGAQVQAAEAAGLMRVTDALEAEVRVLLPLLSSYLSGFKT